MTSDGALVYEDTEITTSINSNIKISKTQVNYNMCYRRENENEKS